MQIVLDALECFFLTYNVFLDILYLVMGLRQPNTCLYAAQGVLDMFRMFSIFVFMSATCLAGDEGDRSVLIKTEEPAVAQTTDNCCGDCIDCTNCVVCPKVYNVTETRDNSFRKRIFGGYVEKTNVKRVYRPAR
jgi:hypothetical protein